jgi:hypothetical protein
MPIILNGSGSIGGANTFTSNASFSGTLGVTGALTQSSGAAFSLASGQIAFPATQNASADANTLDDYEEGTWTPIAGASSGTITSYTSSGVYTKVGRLVYLNGLITITNTGSATNQYVTFSGLPYPSSSAYGNWMGACRENAVDGSLNQVIVNGNSSSGSFLKYNNTGNIVTNAAFYFSVMYFTA